MLVSATTADYKENYTEIVTGFILLPCYMMGLNTKEREESYVVVIMASFLKVNTAWDGMVLRTWMS